ncbi:MAG TPA: hypothetical protein VMV86_06250 [Methanosarcinales archaeon]|nr:hypothetical protein [Methanosarcinales archaeon]
MFSNYDAIYEAGSAENGCRLWDGHNKCCMTDRIEIIVSYPWEDKLKSIICKWGERRV